MGRLAMLELVMRWRPWDRPRRAHALCGRPTPRSRKLNALLCRDFRLRLGRDAPLTQAHALCGSPSEAGQGLGAPGDCCAAESPPRGLHARRHNAAGPQSRDTSRAYIGSAGTAVKRSNRPLRRPTVIPGVCCVEASRGRQAIAPAPSTAVAHLGGSAGPRGRLLRSYGVGRRAVRCCSARLREAPRHRPTRAALSRHRRGEDPRSRPLIARLPDATCLAGLGEAG